MELYSANINPIKDKEMLMGVMKIFVNNIQPRNSRGAEYIIDDKYYNRILDIIKEYYGEFVNLEKIVHRFPEVFEMYGIKPKLKESLYELGFTYNDKPVNRVR